MSGRQAVGTELGTGVMLLAIRRWPERKETEPAYVRLINDGVYRAIENEATTLFLRLSAIPCYFVRGDTLKAR